MNQLVTKVGAILLLLFSSESVVFGRNVCTLQQFAKFPSYCKNSDAISITTKNNASTIEIPILSREETRERGLSLYSKNGPHKDSTFIAGQSEAGSFNLFSTSKGNVVGSFLDLKQHTVSQILIPINGTQIMSVTPSSQFDFERTGDVIPKGELEFNPEVFRGNNNTRRRTNENNGDIIDVMVVWTKKAECFHARQSKSCTVNENTKDQMKVKILQRYFCECLH